MMFNESFNTVLGGVLLAVMLLLLGGFIVCINLLITKESLNKSLVTPSEIFDKEYTDMDMSDMDITMKNTTIASTGPHGDSVNTSVQSAPVNISELRRKKQQERRNSKPIALGPRLTSSPKQKSKLATSPYQSPTSAK